MRTSGTSEDERGRAHHVYIPNTARITPDHLTETIDRVKSLRTCADARLSGNGVFRGMLQIDLDQLLTGAQRQEGLLAEPLETIVAQLVGLALLFVVAMAAVLVEGQAVEIAPLLAGQFATSLRLGRALRIGED